jgi:hypothetical protein
MVQDLDEIRAMANEMRAHRQLEIKAEKLEEQAEEEELEN